MNPETAQETAAPPTLDLAELARIQRGDRVDVQVVTDSTQELFDKTLALVQQEAGAAPAASRPPGAALEVPQFVPENDDLRVIYLLAEAVGGYETFHDIVNVHSPGSTLSRRYSELASERALKPDEVQRLREYRAQIHRALENANAYLRDTAVYRFNREELHQLHEIILAASERARELNRVMGTHLIHELDACVQRLHEIQSKMRSVERSMDGVFLVDSEVMFIPHNELVRIVNVLFEAVGNSHLSKNVDGVMLLAARNLLIEVASFYSFYGKHQIYNVLKRGGANTSTQAITARIRYEIRKLFEACMKDNKLVLTRVMKDAERQFEISVEVIQEEAEEAAIQAVAAFIPPDEPPPPPPRPTLFQRLFGWLRRG